MGMGMGMEDLILLRRIPSTSSPSPSRSSSSSNSSSSSSSRHSSVFGFLFVLIAVGIPFILSPTCATAISLSLSGTYEGGRVLVPQPQPLSLSGRRTLLQVQQGCSVSFENLNYTSIISQCKGPKYPVKTCCTAFKNFACPYADQINDLTNNCATTMFSYIDLYGKYPPGLFANECQDSKRGLECSTAHSSSPDTAATPTSNAAASLHLLSPLSFLVFFTLFLY